MILTPRLFGLRASHVTSIVGTRALRIPLCCAIVIGLLGACGRELPEERLGRALAEAKRTLRQCREKVPVPTLEEYREPLRSHVKAALTTYDFLGLSEDDKLQVFRSQLSGEAATDFDALPKREQHKVVEAVTLTYRAVVRERCSSELDSLEAAIEARDLYLRSRRRLAPRRFRNRSRGGRDNTPSNQGMQPSGCARG